MLEAPGGRSRRARLIRPLLVACVACVAFVTFAGCGGSDSSSKLDDAGSGRDAQIAAPGTGTTVPDPFKTPDPVVAELGEPVKVGDVEDGKYVTITIDKVLSSEPDEADPTTLRAELDAAATSNAPIELAANVWCDGDDEPVTQSGTLGGAGWNAFASGGLISFEPDDPSPTEPLIVRVPADCESPALELTPATIEGQLASVKVPVRWTLTGVGE